jgi:hypothetical protein
VNAPLVRRSTHESVVEGYEKSLAARDALIREQEKKIADQNRAIATLNAEHAREVAEIRQQARDQFQDAILASTEALAEAYEEVAAITRTLSGRGRPRICARCTNGVGEHNEHCVGARIVEYATIKAGEYRARLPPLHDATAPTMTSALQGEDAKAAMDENGVSPDEHAVFENALASEPA